MFRPRSANQESMSAVDGATARPHTAGEGKICLHADLQVGGGKGSENPEHRLNQHEMAALYFRPAGCGYGY